MSTNRDASLTTKRRSQLALYGWRTANQFPQNPQSVVPEQKNVGSSVSVDAYIGAQLVGQAGGSCACSPNVTLKGYAPNSPAK
jgi:hypothetical protein